MMTLKDSQNGKKYIIEKSTLKQPVKQRLEALGLIEGTMVRKINEALDGSIIFMVRGTRLAMGKEIAKFIFVRDVTASDTKHKKRSHVIGLKDNSGKNLRDSNGIGHRDVIGIGRKIGVE
ncbi:MAG: FeoA family protein [Eubacteriales bacterium]|nr:FeoA family protein [Eubacteriales bacterium]MDD3200139.1 FeoA family protein [Eubacteriales bacterium]MDD4630407.1 FeoA family protein [Eubacteriales bacterium]